MATKKNDIEDLINHLQKIYKTKVNASVAEKEEIKKRKQDIGTIEDVGSSTRYYWDTGNYVLNYNICGNMIEGGWMGSKFTQIVGDPQTGKSLLVAQALADASHMENVIPVALDTERALESDSISGLGGNPKRVVYYPIETVEEMIASMKNILEWKKASDPSNKKKMIVGIDSMANLSSIHEKENPDKVDMTKAKKNRLFFRLYGNEFYKNNITVLGTNHLIANIGGYGAAQVTTGGSGGNYNSSCTLKMLTTGKSDEKSTAKEIIKTTLRPKVDKIRGRGGRLYRQCEIDFYYETGIDRWSGIVEHLVKYNICKSHSSKGYFIFEFEGVMYNEKSRRVDIIKTLKNNPEVFKRINDVLYQRVIEKTETQNMNREYIIAPDVESEGFKEELPADENIYADENVTVDANKSEKKSTKK